MPFRPKLETSKKLPMTALFDVVFLLIIFFLLSTTLSGGRRDVLGIKDIINPIKEGNTSSNILVQLFEHNERVKCFVIGGGDDQMEIDVLKQMAADGSYDIRRKSSVINAFMSRNIKALSINELERVLKLKVKEYKRAHGEKGKQPIKIALRTEYNIKYVDVIEAIDILVSESMNNIADVEYVLLIGDVERSNSEKEGLLDKIEFVEPDKPKIIPSIDTPKEVRPE